MTIRESGLLFWAPCMIVPFLG